jgi:hypothetical protein
VERRTFYNTFSIGQGEVDSHTGYGSKAWHLFTP